VDPRPERQGAEGAHLHGPAVAVAPPSTSELLEAWERGLREPLATRCLPLLAAAGRGASPEHVARLPVGERDAWLLELHEWAFGSSMSGTARCPSCGADLELPVDASEIRAAAATAREPPGLDGDAGLEVDGYAIRFRLPDSVDMREASRAAGVDDARSVLLRRCLLSATRRGVEVDPAAVPGAVLERIEAAMETRARASDIRIAMSCPECRHEWKAELDVGLFVWREIDQWARRLLVDVATLAAAFGWTEGEVLRLRPARREAYLELARR
jgi:hypothetical protein